MYIHYPRVLLSSLIQCAVAVLIEDFVFHPLYCRILISFTDFITFKTSNILYIYSYYIMYCITGFLQFSKEVPIVMLVRAGSSLKLQVYTVAVIEIILFNLFCRDSGRRKRRCYVILCTESKRWSILLFKSILCNQGE